MERVRGPIPKRNHPKSIEVYHVRIGIISSGTKADRIPPIYGGGIQKYSWNLARELNKLGHEVHVFTILHPGESRDEALDGVFIHRISRFLGMNVFNTIIFGLKAFFRILHVQKKTGPFHILHAQSRVSSLLIRYLFPYKIPFIITAHNWDVLLTVPAAVLSRPTYFLVLFMEKLACLKSDGVISLTEFFKKILLNRLKLPSSKVQVIPNMITIRESHKKPADLQPIIKKIVSESYLLYIGRLEKEKGLNFLIEKFKDITNQQENLKLVLVGRGSLELELKRLGKKFKIDDKLYLLGGLHENQLSPLLKAARALILPSHFEIMPTVILEAWAAGCPVIANNYQGVQALIRHESTGLIFQKDKGQHLPSVVQKLFTKKNLRDIIIKNAKAQIRSKHASSQVVKQIIAMYRDLVNRCNQ